MRFKLLLYLLCACCVSIAQDNTLDSLKLALKKASQDTVKCGILAELSEVAPEGEWQKYNEELYELAKKDLGETNSKQPLYKTYANYLANALNNKGFNAHQNGNTEEAINCFLKGLSYFEETGDKKGASSCINNIGTLYNEQGNISKALEFYLKSLKVREELNDKRGMVTTLNNIGIIYQNQSDYSNALSYYKKGLSLAEQIAFKTGTAMSLRNIGVSYQKCDSSSNSVLNFLNRSLTIYEEIKNQQGVAEVLNDIGVVYQSTNQNDKAIPYLMRAAEIEKEVGDTYGYACTLNNIASNFLRVKNYPKSLELGLLALNIGKKLNSPLIIRGVAELLKDVYTNTGKYRDAVEMYALYFKMNDSINNENLRKTSIRKQLQYEFEKKAIADSVKVVADKKVTEAKLSEQEARLTQQKTQRFALWGGIIMAVVFAGFMYNRFRNSQKQKEIIELQKDIVEEKQKEILDSIRYAKKIQNALITSEKYIEKSLKKLQNKS